LSQTGASSNTATVTLTIRRNRRPLTPMNHTDSPVEGPIVSPVEYTPLPSNQFDELLKMNQTMTALLILAFIILFLLTAAVVAMGFFFYKKKNST